jgi:N-acetylmuramic acid 6-phosphate etherase
MSIGVSYFGNRILRHVAADMEDLAARGFTGVLHTFSENDHAHYREQIGEMVRVSHELGLRVQVNPWGVGHLFGGEAESRFTAEHPEVGQVLSDGRRIGAGCPNHPTFRRFLREWATAAVETGADEVFWDEPHWAHPARFARGTGAWACRCEHCHERYAELIGGELPATFTEEVRHLREASLVDALGELLRHVRDLGGRNTVCLLPLTDGPLGLHDWDAVAGLEGLDVLATDPYWKAFDEPVEPFVRDLSARVVDLTARYGVEGQIWIQGFGLGPEDADDIRTAVETARAAGVDDLWTWGYEACGHMPGLGTREPERVWQVLCEALTTTTALDAGPGEGEEERLGALGTEGVRHDLTDLDLRSTDDLVRLLVAEHVRATEAVLRAAPALAVAVDAVAERFGRGGRIVYAGAGTAGRLAVVDAAECPPTFGTDPARVVALLAGADAAVGRAVEGAEDDRAAGGADVVGCELQPDDTLVAVSASGRTPYVLGAVAAAREAGALTVGVAGNVGSRLGAVVDHAIEIPTGPEPLAGSTRLKAGTAQKAVLNTLSTAVMIRAGRTFGNLMVDVRATNGKLWERARRLVVTVADVDVDRAEAALTAADGHAKTAIVALVRDVEPAAARELLDEADGRLRVVLEA